MSVEKEKTKALLSGACWVLSGTADSISVGENYKSITYGLDRFDYNPVVPGINSLVRVNISFSAYADSETARKIYKALTDKNYRQDLLLAGI